MKGRRDDRPLRPETTELNGNPFFIRHLGTRICPQTADVARLPGGILRRVKTILAPLLADGFTCIAPDQRANGQSWRPTEVEHYKTAKLVSD